MSNSLNLVLPDAPVVVPPSDAYQVFADVAKEIEKQSQDRIKSFITEIKENDLSIGCSLYIFLPTKNAIEHRLYHAYYPSGNFPVQLYAYGMMGPYLNSNGEDKLMSREELVAAIQKTWNELPVKNLLGSLNQKSQLRKSKGKPHTS